MFNNRGFANLLLLGVLTVLSLFGAGAAEAQSALDVASVTTAMGEAETGVTTIAGTMLGVVAAGIAVKWVLGFIIN